MPFYFRKSIRLGGGTRMNFSKSGIGFSTGGKGFRVSTGPRGTYVNLGTGGIYYRQKIGGPYGQASPPSSPLQPSDSFQTGTPIATASVDQLVESTSAAMLESLNTTIKRPVYAWMFVVGGLILGAALGTINPIIFVAVFGLFLYIASIAKQMDQDRRTYTLTYHFVDDTTKNRWTAMNSALAALGRTRSLWRITTLDHNYDWKRNAGATSLLNRIRASLVQQPAIYIASNLTPYCLHIGTQSLFFFPDRIYVYENGTYGAVEYGGLNVSWGETRFIESDACPSDAQPVGSTWQYVNKNGGPDRRFNNNRQLPIMNYGVVELRSVSGLNLLLHVSSIPAANQFGTLYQQSQTVVSPSASYQPRQSQPPPHNRQQQRPSAPPPSPSVPNCYKVLGLNSDCTKEEAAAKYRQLASSYHPDRVNHLAPEFKALAHQKMTEINTAFADLKRSRGW